MKASIERAGWSRFPRRVIASTCALLLVTCTPALFAGQAQQPQQQSAQQNVKIPAGQLDSLVAPIALYPDPLLSQTLVASTYPLEIIQLQQWLEKHKGLDQTAMAAEVKKQPWDPSIQAMAALPDVVKQMSDNIQWTTDLGNAFLANQKDVMDAVQRMRVKAQAKGTLKSDQHQKVENEVVQDKSVVVIEQANPDVVYVPSYDPTVVYGAAAYPYPPIYYPTGGVLAASAISWGAGIAMGAMWGGGWGWGAGWGHNDITNNFNNSFNRSANLSGTRAANARGTWQHNPQHRGGTPYADRATANRFGSNARGDSLASRQKGAQQQIARQKGNLPSAANRAGGVGGRQGAGNLGAAGGGGLGARSGVSGTSFGGGDRIGNRSLGSSSSFGDRGGFSGGGFSGSSARASSSRGASSMRSAGRSGGGFGGGGRGGGGRGGGRR